MYKKNPKLLNQFQYSEREGVPLLVIVGEEEKARGGVKIRDTHSRQEVAELGNIYITIDWSLLSHITEFCGALRVGF